MIDNFGKCSFQLLSGVSTIFVQQYSTNNIVEKYLKLILEIINFNQNFTQPFHNNFLTLKRKTQEENITSKLKYCLIF